MKETTRLAIVAVAASVLNGCGVRYFSDRTTDPVIEDYIRPSTDREEFGVLSITASKRNAYIKLNKDETVGVVCAEPPPDVGETFAKAFAAELSGETQGVTATGALSSSAATAIAPLLFRSQGLQMYRDAVSHLCFAYMNGVISKDQLLTEEKDRWQAATTLIKDELQHMPNFAPQNQRAPTAPELRLRGR